MAQKELSTYYKKERKMIPAILMKDGYKADHRSQYPEGTEYIYANFTPRGSRIKGCDSVVVFGVQYLIKKFLIEEFTSTFFTRPKEQVLQEYQSIMDSYLGPGMISTDHLRELHDLGYLPIHIKALPEGTRCPIKVPFMTIVNTDPRFFWLTNMLETLISTTLWHPITSATTADRYRRLFDEFSIETGGADWFTSLQGHDFSMRGMCGVEAATVSAAAHLTSFTGTDTIPAIPWLNKYYYADREAIVGCSVPATEHSVMCLGEKATEIDTFKRLVNEIYPNGIVSIVSDTWDFWQVVTEFLPALKDDIMARDGKVVIRPDSGDPVDIICGTDDYLCETPEQKGLIQCLWETFGGTVNEAGYKVLDPHIGAIYGDSITYERAQAILSRLKAQGFASDNIVFGIGSYTYQYVTRDTHGFAVKATMGVVNGEQRAIFKDPKTDSGLKKSAKGLLHVTEDLKLVDECTWLQEDRGALRTVFKNGLTYNETSLTEIRERLRK
jgi:nicotinamide phosphoribosyltransferase